MKWTPEPFEADDGSVPFEAFASELSDFKFAALDAAVRNVLAERGLELAATEWLKALGQGLHEFRIRHSEEEIERMFGTGSSAHSGGGQRLVLRVFVHFYGDKVVLLLGGYDKGKSPHRRRQQREIEEARRLLRQFKERRRRSRRAE